MQKTFHPECFVCAYCGKIFANSPFYLEDGLPYCEEGMTNMFILYNMQKVLHIAVEIKQNCLSLSIVIFQIGTNYSQQNVSLVGSLLKLEIVG